MEHAKEATSEVLFWINEDELQAVFSSRYWNNEEIEKEKDLYILNGNSDNLFIYLKEKTTYFAEYESIIRFAGDKGLKIGGVGIDLASGICWTTALLSRIEAVRKIYALDISRHRLLKIAPKVFELFGADKNKIIRVVGSFYDIRVPDNSVDFCFMSQAFHHADNPDRLLSEVYRILKPSGIVLIIGESPVYLKSLFKRYIKNIIKIATSSFISYKTRPIYNLLPSFTGLFPPNIETGDYHYRVSDYYRIFKSNGFLLYANRQRHFMSFAAIKQ